MDRNSEKHSKSDRPARRQSNPSTTLEGRIASIDRVKIGSADHFVAKVEFYDGTTRLVAVNNDRVQTMSDLDMLSGDKVKIRGQQKTLNGRRVLVADAVTVNGESLQISSR